MSAGTTHIIHKLNAELTLRHDDNHHEKSEYLKQAILQAVDRVEKRLDQTDSNSLLKIDSLTVEISLKENEFHRLEDELAKELSVKFDEIIPVKNQTSKIPDKRKMSAGISFEDTREELIKHFLQTGLLPWWANPDDMQQTEQWLKSLTANRIRNLFKPAIGSNQIAVHRLISQWPFDVQETIIKTLADDQYGSGSFSIFLKKIIQFPNQTSFSKEISLRLQRQIMFRVLQGMLKKSGKETITNKLFTDILQSNTEEKSIKQKLTGWAEELEKSESISFPKKALSDLIARGQLSKSKKRIRQTSASEIKNGIFPADESDSITVFNAGVVILQPFLPMLFKNLGYTEDGIFTGSQARERAVCAIHFLATGRVEFPEHELLISKFLTGWPFHEPINRFLHFTDYEIEECKSLLADALSHWGVLKNTSADGLRKNFLQREGILKHSEFGWSLHIERQTHDLLLDQLPWSISIIKFKWMDEVLSVRWSE
jgi:hypothetical protein